VITETLKFRLPDGTETTVEAQLDETPLPAGEFLVARPISLTGDERRMRQHRAVGGRHREEGFERLDNEIMVGRRLAEAAGRGSYPAEVARLCGDDADGTDPYVLFAEYRNKPLREAWKSMKEAELKAFPASLLRGLCWLAAVGVAHRGIGPDTVWWDGRRAVITDFSTSMVFGAARTPVRGFPAWIPGEQRTGTVSGWIGSRDDIWAAAQLIFYTHTKGQECDSPEQLASSGLDEPLVKALAWGLSPVAARPTAGELLAYLGGRDPSPSGSTGGASLLEGRDKFLAARRLKHRKAPVPEPADLNEDLKWALGASSTPPSAVPVAAELLPAGPPMFAVSPGGELPASAGSTMRTATGQQAALDQAGPPELVQQPARRKRIFGRWQGGQ
jgi:hypothetical protein